jgi:signal peptidase II
VAPTYGCIVVTQPLSAGARGHVGFLHAMDQTNVWLLSGNSAALSLLSTAISVALVVWLVRHSPQSTWQILAFGFLLGGAAGNGLDRLRLGEVVDFLELVPIHFPIFNLADVAINLAVLCFAIDILRARQRRADS